MKYIKNAVYTTNVVLLIMTFLALTVASDAESYRNFNRVLYCLGISTIISMSLYLYNHYVQEDPKRGVNSVRRKPVQPIHIDLHTTYIVTDYNKHRNPYATPLVSMRNHKLHEVGKNIQRW